ncbi:hypothetical protein JCM33374_g1397 [Metschnikowia sp. JCM 33374]|nr:hypothetical protein JCM33374_g1397 [Metschnikowia sp. JCM 33374]
MKLFAIFALFTMVLANKMVSIGNLFITTIHNQYDRFSLSFENKQLLCSHKRSMFFYDESRYLELYNSGTFLKVNEAGKLVSDDKPHIGFRLTLEPESLFKRTLSYNGGNVFELCADGSVGFRSNCDGARKAVITHEEIFH